MKTNLTSKQENLDIISKKGTCIEFFSAYQDMDIDRMLGLCDPQGIISFEPLGDAFKGKIYETGKGVWSALMASFPDLDNTVKQQQYNETDNSIGCIVDIFGTQEKDFAGIPSKGNKFDSEHIFIFRFNEEEKIKDIRINWNHESFVNQLSK